MRKNPFFLQSLNWSTVYASPYSLLTSVKHAAIRGPEYRTLAQVIETYHAELRASCGRGYFTLHFNSVLALAALIAFGAWRRRREIVIGGACFGLLVGTVYYWRIADCAGARLEDFFYFVEAVDSLSMIQSGVPATLPTLTLASPLFMAAGALALAVAAIFMKPIPAGSPR